MSTVIVEHYGSRAATLAEDASRSSYRLAYRVLGSEDDAEVRARVEATLPAYYAGMRFQQYSIEHQGGGVWIAEAQYAVYIPKTEGESVFTFDTTGGTQHITQSKETTGLYSATGQAAPSFEGAIGVNGDSVEGCDITVPVYAYEETHYVPHAAVTEAYRSVILALTGKVNAAAFKGMARGECLFQGARGSRRGLGPWEITYRFAGSQNLTDDGFSQGLTIGEVIEVRDKLGWEYLWVRYADAVDGVTLVRKPRYAYTERVYDFGDFSLLGIGTT